MSSSDFNPFSVPTPPPGRPRVERDPSIEHEPHMQHAGYELDVSEQRAEETLAKQPQTLDDAVDHSVWDEPGIHSSLSGELPEGAINYDRWLAGRIQATTRAQSNRMVGLVALASGVSAILGTLVWGPGHRNSWAAVCVVGPLVEEVMKVAMAIWVVERRPYLFQSRRQILLCAALSGLTFAALENALYLNVYIPNPTSSLVTTRWTVCVALHTVCSLMAGVGLTKVWADTMTNRRRPQLSLASSWMIAAIVVHGGYNLAALLWALSR